MRPTHRAHRLALALAAALLPLIARPIAVFAEEPSLAGTTTGLYRLERGSSTCLYAGTEVRKIARAGSTWILLTSDGILTSPSLASFEPRNSGLPVKVVKTYEAGAKGFRRETQELKDLAVHPTNPAIMVTATKDAVYLTRDAGLSWKSLGLAASTAGVKAVACLDLADAQGKPALTVFMSHPIYGVSWIQPDAAKPAWADLNAGLYSMPTVKWPDEVSDLAAFVRAGRVELYAGQSFAPRIYRLDWEGRRFMPIWAGAGHADGVDGMSVSSSGDALVASSPGVLREISLSPDAPRQSLASGSAPDRAKEPAEAVEWLATAGSAPGDLLSAWVPPARSGGRGALSLSELWLLRPDRRLSPYAKIAEGRKGTYVPVHQATTPAGLERHLGVLRANKLNMIVIDMKDDYGNLRYDARDPLVLRKGTVRNPVDLDALVARSKKDGIYLVARIVVFKDRSLYRYANGAYAVWDRAEGKPWQGYEIETRKIEVAAPVPPQAGAAAGNASPTPEQPRYEEVRKYYDEYWVDPFSEEVWEYNVAIARELVSRGFDEIQFDYIRFPTDGENLGNARYRWQEAGMDKESALMSFLSYARSHIQAPISIDIYGANGWYRTGARTGQDVELLARYVDVICPMFYPSHFEQGFLAYDPAEERTYRIYYYGSFRNAVIARNHVVVRPWAQAFYIGVSFDRKYYNEDYVQRQVFGTRDALNLGYTYWNNSGRYADLRPDVGIDVPYPWKTPEAEPDRPRPAFGAKRKDGGR